MKFRTRDDACETLAGALAATLRAATSAHGAASAVVSGGDSPRGVFRLLRTLRLPWEAVTLVPSDERWVSPEHADSNEGMIRHELLSGRPSAARFVSFYRPLAAPAAALPGVADEVARVRRPFDAVVLGIGEDGHTASLFPDAPDVADVLRSEADVVVQNFPRLAHARISLTLHALLDAHEIHLLFFGGAKLAVYRRAMQEGPIEQYPIRGILHQTAVGVTAYWAP